MRIVQLQSKNKTLLILDNISVVSQSSKKTALLIAYPNGNITTIDYDSEDLVLSDIEIILNNATKTDEVINTLKKNTVTITEAIKEKVSDNIKDLKKEPYGFLITNPYTSMLYHYPKGTILDIVFRSEKYQVLSEDGVALFQAISDEAPKYGMILYR